MKNSIAYKYLGIATAILVTGQLCLGFLQSHWHYSSQLKSLEQRVQDRSEFLSVASAESIINLDFFHLENLVEQTSKDVDLVYSVIIDDEGKALTDFLNKQNPLIAQIINNNLDTNTLDIINLVERNSAIYSIEKKITYNEKLLGKIWLGYSRQNIKLEFYKLATFHFINALITSILLAGFTVILFEKQLSNPLEKTTTLEPEIANQETDGQANPQNKETGLLEDFFRQMAIQLKQTIESLQKNNEELVITNAELTRATRLKDEFLASMSHELRTPLNAILGLSDALRDEVYGTLTEKQLQSLTTIHSSGKHLLSLINDILDLSKIESGKEQLDLCCIDISYLCNASLELIKEQASEKNIQLNSQIETGLGCVELDERRIKQVLINLLNNAVKFTPDGGEVTLRVWGEPQEERIIFRVTDTGIGIKPENMNKLFESFVQIESRLSRRYGGTGLGLALVKNIIELHGGSISVTSEVNKGSQFTVIIPWKKTINLNSETELSMANPGLSINHSQSLILIVEDNDRDRLRMSDYLKNQGYKLIFAQNIFEAIKIAQEQKPSLIIIDLQIPPMERLTAISRIKRERKIASIPIIALTSLIMPGDREKYLAAGVNEYLTKPVNLTKLVSNIEKQLAKNLNNNLITN